MSFYDRFLCSQKLSKNDNKREKVKKKRFVMVEDVIPKLLAYDKTKSDFLVLPIVLCITITLTVGITFIGMRHAPFTVTINQIHQMVVSFGSFDKGMPQQFFSGGSL